MFLFYTNPILIAAAVLPALRSGVSAWARRNPF